MNCWEGGCACNFFFYQTHKFEIEICMFDTGTQIDLETNAPQVLEVNAIFHSHN